jgi:hypothetical protein
VDAQRIGRVPQPPGLSSNAGNLEEVVDWGSPSFGYFSLAKQDNVVAVETYLQVSRNQK